MLRSHQRGRIPLGPPQGGLDLAGQGLRGRARNRCRTGSFGEHRPIPVRGIEVTAAVARAPVGVDGRRQVDPTHPGGRRELAIIRGFLPGQPHRGRPWRQQPVVTGQRGHVRMQPRIDPTLGSTHILRVHRQPRSQRQAGLPAGVDQHVDLGPGPLGVDVVRCQRAHPAEVVHAGVEQGHQLGGVREVGRGLHPKAGPEHDPGGGQRRQVCLMVQVVGVPAHGIRLGAEVLDDHLLHVPVLASRGAQRQHRLRQFRRRLTDAHQQPCGERHVAAAGVSQHPQSHGRVLVRRPVVHLTRAAEQAVGGRLQHHPHAGGHRPQPLQLSPAQHPGIQVRQ